MREEAVGVGGVCPLFPVELTAQADRKLRPMHVQRECHCSDASGLFSLPIKRN